MGAIVIVITTTTTIITVGLVIVTTTTIATRAWVQSSQLQCNNVHQEGDGSHDNNTNDNVSDPQCTERIAEAVTMLQHKQKLVFF